MKALKRRVIASALSVVTAITMLLSNYVPTVAARPIDTGVSNPTPTAQVNDPSTVTITTEDGEGIEITKTATYDKETGKVSVKFVVNGNDATVNVSTVGKTAIVFVMDASNSMKGNKITNAKAAAKSFADELLKNNTTENPDTVKVGLVSFTSNASTKTFGVGNKGFTTDINAFKTAVDGVTNNSGTNIQAGIHAANALLNSSEVEEGATKIIVLLGDGNPTQGFKASALTNEKVTLNYADRTTELETYLPINFDYNHITQSERSWNYEAGYSLPVPNSANGYYYNNTLVTSDEANIINANGTYYCVVARDSEWYYQATTTDVDKNNRVSIGNKKYTLNATQSGKIYTSTSLYHYGDTVVELLMVTKKSTEFPINHGLTAISEAKIAKDQGVIIYSIGYDISNEAHAEYTLRNCASAGKFKSSDVDGLSDVMALITSSVQKDVDAAKGAHLVDTFPSYMTPVSVDDEESATIEGNKVTWNLKDLGADDTKEVTIETTLDVNGMIAAYAAKTYPDDDLATAIKKVKADMNTTDGVWFDMNDSVVVTYTNVKDETITDDRINASAAVTDAVGVPEVPFKSYSFNVTYKIDGVEQADKAVSENYVYKDTVKFSSLPNIDTNKYTETYVVTGATATINNDFSMPEGDVSVVVNYTTKKFTVNFIDGVTGQPIKTMNDVTYGTVIQDTDVPEIPDHTDIGKTNGQWNVTPLGTEITDNTDFTVNYGSIVPTVTFKVIVADGEAADTVYESAALSVTWNDDNELSFPSEAIAKFPQNPEPVVDVSGTEDLSETVTTYKTDGWKLSTNAQATLTETGIKNVKESVVVTITFTSESAEYYKLYLYRTIQYEGGNNVTELVKESEFVSAGTPIPDIAPVVCPEDDAEWDYEVTKDFQPSYTVDGYTTDTAIITATKQIKKVMFVYDSESNDGFDAVNVKYGDSVSADDKKIADDHATDKAAQMLSPEFEYSFAGWTDAEGNAVVLPAEVTEDITVYASYTATKRKYNVTFRGVGNVQVGDVQQVEYGKSATAPANPAGFTVNNPDGSRYVFTFTRWNKDYSFIKEDTVVDSVFTSTYYPYTPEPDNPQPDDPQPDNPQPDDPQPDDPQPDNPQPDNPQPDNPQPDNPQPGNPEPDEPEPEVVIEPEPVPQAPEVEIEPEPAPLAPEVEIEEEDVPLAAADHCLVHWIVLLSSVLYGAYVAVRGISLKKENEAKLGTSNN